MGLNPSDRIVTDVPQVQIIRSLLPLGSPNHTAGLQGALQEVSSRLDLADLEVHDPTSARYPHVHLYPQPTPDAPRGLIVSDNRPFDNDTISIVVFLSSIDQCPYFLMRTVQNNTPWYSMFGAHELCIEREGSALQLKRWSRSEQCSKLWVALYFLTWEGE